MEISQYQADPIAAVREAAKNTANIPVVPVTPVDPPGQSQNQAGEQDPPELFATLLDAVNPLQNIPVVSTAYRAITGDQTSPLANMAGGFIFGGPVGLAAGAASSFLQMVTGKDLLGLAMGLFDGDQPPNGVQSTQLTSAAPEGFEALGGLASPAPMSLQQYQAFAAAKSAQNIGTGAADSAVGWATNLWTDSALQGAGGLLGDAADSRNNPDRSDV